jgi:pyrroloquinoline quinone (PQQ) biosynthesis protein C
MTTPAVDHLAYDENDNLVVLAKKVYTHGALRNAFYRLWMSEQLDLEGVAAVYVNYGTFVRRFPEVLAVMILHTDDVHARAEYAKTLFSEMGYGQVRSAHSVLFDGFFRSLGKQMGAGEDFDYAKLVKTTPVLPETMALIEGEKRLYSMDRATAAGAQLALEWQAYTMLSQLYEGARNYMHLWPDSDSFHEAAEYYYAHIGEAEKEHKIESLNGAKVFDTSAEARANIEHGFYTHLNLFEKFWGALAEAVKGHVVRSSAKPLAKSAS